MREVFVVVYKHVIYVSVNSYHGSYINVLSFIVRGPTIIKL